MKKMLLMIFVTLFIFTGCSTNRNAKEFVDLSSSQQQYDKSETSDYEAIVDIQKCEYKAMQTIINMFGQVKPNDIGEYTFDYFTDNGFKQYEEYAKWASDKTITTVGIANGTTSGMNETKDKITTMTWFAYKNSEARTCFEINFIKQNNEWLIDTIGLDS